MEEGTLYIVATPIGNLKDITLRAIEILEKVEYIACEDTRKTGQLLRSLSLKNKPMLISYYEGKEMIRIPNILNLLLNGKDVALLSDGGTPLISDPGYPLVRECLKRNLKVVSIPGPSALISALVSSGQPPDKFIFLGFLPKKQGNRLKILTEVKESNKKLEASVILYEAPHKLVKTLEDLNSVFGDIKISLLRELTKIYEELEYKSISEFIIKFESQKPKGEYVIILNPKMY